MPSLKAKKKELTAAEIKPLVEEEGEKLPAPISPKNLYQFLYKRSNDGLPTRFYKTREGKYGLSSWKKRRRLRSNPELALNHINVGSHVLRKRFQGLLQTADKLLQIGPKATNVGL